MVFSSLIFLYAFFPISLLFCFLFKEKKKQNIVLLIFSLIFYAWGEPKYVLLLLLMSFVSWYCARKIDESRRHHRHHHHHGQSGQSSSSTLHERGSHGHYRVSTAKRYVILAAVVDIGLIGFFKYSPLICSVFGEVPGFIQNIGLPIGISFYTFQLLTYVVDVYKKEAPAQRKFSNVLLYAALLHQCIAGPIVRYKTIEEDLFGEEPRHPRISRGVRRFTVGLAKKVLLANACGALADSLFPASNLSLLSSGTALGAWTGLIAYALQIYLDFSAYSDMAIGMGLMLGLHYPENFNYPYISRSVTDFWRRWHMSLGTFFRDYVYIPLGGSHCSKPRMVLNTLIVWALTGLWHGASWNFVLWGLWFFVFLMLERAFLKPYLEKLPVVSNLYLLLVVLLGWIIFRLEDLSMVGTMLKTMFGANGFTDIMTSAALKGNFILLIVSSLACLPFGKRGVDKLEDFCMQHTGNHLNVIYQVVFYGIIPVVLLLLSTSALVGITFNPFLYFQF